MAARCFLSTHTLLCRAFRYIRKVPRLSTESVRYMRICVRLATLAYETPAMFEEHLRASVQFIESDQADAEQIESCTYGRASSRTRFIEAPDVDAQGYIVDPGGNEIFVAFRGTSSFKDVLVNIDAKLAPMFELESASAPESASESAPESASESAACCTWTPQFRVQQQQQKKAQCKAHSGFLMAYKQLEPLLVQALLPVLRSACPCCAQPAGAVDEEKDKDHQDEQQEPEPEVMRIILCGHSSGGALAVLAAATLRLALRDALYMYTVGQAAARIEVSCITFGCPRVGNGHLVRRLAAETHPATSARILYDNDPVGHVPIRPEYVHGGQFLWFKESWLAGDRLCYSSTSCSPEKDVHHRESGMDVSWFRRLIQLCTNLWVSDHECVNYIRACDTEGL